MALSAWRPSPRSIKYQTQERDQLPDPAPVVFHDRPMLRQRARLDLHARAHGGGHRDALDIGALGTRRLRLDDRISERLDVLDQLVLGERGLADAGLDDAGLFDAEL